MWPGTIKLKRERGLVCMFVLPLVFGARTVGCISLSFRSKQPLSPSLLHWVILQLVWVV